MFVDRFAGNSPVVSQISALTKSLGAGNAEDVASYLAMREASEAAEATGGQGLSQQYAEQVLLGRRIVNGEEPVSDFAELPAGPALQQIRESHVLLGSRLNQEAVRLYAQDLAAKGELDERQAFLILSALPKDDVLDFLDKEIGVEALRNAGSGIEKERAYAGLHRQDARDMLGIAVESSGGIPYVQSKREWQGRVGRRG
jgi:hypothetical protein